MVDPLSHIKLNALIHNLMHQIASNNWIHRFLQKNAGKINMRRAHRLDPNWAQAFNPLVVKCHFNQLKSLIIELGIPPENIYNEDEKGIQLGGGRKNLPLQYIFSSKDRQRYVTWSDSLILVTLLEVVSADGATIPCMFVLPKGQVSMDDLELLGMGR